VPRGDVAKLLDEIEARVAQLRVIVASPAGPVAPDLGERVLADVLTRGGSVGRKELYEIAESHGMDRRGLGGFFRETGQKSLMDLPGTDRIVLTPYGAERAQRHLNRQRATPYETVEPNLSRVAEASFAEDWNSEGDAAYDDL
jgi:hypothetical protein